MVLAVKASRKFVCFSPWIDTIPCQSIAPAKDLIRSDCSPSRQWTPQAQQGRNLTK